MMKSKVVLLMVLAFSAVFSQTVSSQALKIFALGDSHWAGQFQTGYPGYYLQQAGYDVTISAEGGRAMYQYNPAQLYWRPSPIAPPPDVVLIALMTNDIEWGELMKQYARPVNGQPSPNTVYWYWNTMDIYLRSITAYLPASTDIYVVLPTYFKSQYVTNQGQMNFQVFIWKFIEKAWITTWWGDRVQFIDASLSGQQPGPDGKHYLDSECYSDYLNYRLQGGPPQQMVCLTL
jgi:hypothetical protein